MVAVLDGPIEEVAFFWAGEEVEVSPGKAGQRFRNASKVLPDKVLTLKAEEEVHRLQVIVLDGANEAAVQHCVLDWYEQEMEKGHQQQLGARNVPAVTE